MAYRGATARLPVGAQGFTGTRNPSQAGPGHLVYTDGAELDGGIIRKEGGAQRLNSVSMSNVVVSGISWSPVAGVNHDVVFLSSGSVKRDTGAGTFPDTLVSGLTNVREPPPVFVTAGGEGIGGSRKLYLFSGPNQVQFVAGTGGAMANIPTPPADWTGGGFPTFGVQHASRLWGGGNGSDPHRIYYSTIANHGDFTGGGAGTLPIYPGEGERLVGGISFRTALILFKYPVGVYVVNTNDLTPANWSVARLSKAVGTLNQHTIVQIENEIIYMDHIGNIHALSATQEFGGINTSNISQAIADLEPFIRLEINRAAMRRVVGVWYPSKSQAWFSLPRLGTTDNDLRILIGMEQADQGGRPAPRFFMSRRDVAVSMWMRPDADGVQKPVIGDNVGFVWTLDGTSRNKNGVSYPIRLETANTDLAWLDEALATKSKSAQFLELTVEPRGDWDLTVEVFFDDIQTSVIQYNMGGAGAVIGSFTLDTDKLGSDSVRSNRQRCVGSGRRMKLIAFNSGLDQDISIAEFHLSFTVTDERVTEA